MPTKLEYIWLDGYQPEPSLRSKTKIVSSEPSDPSDCPEWSFDGSSTEQAEGGSSDCLLKPVRIVPDPGRKDAFLVMTEVLTADGSVHPSNFRGTFQDDSDFWFGFEQEYTLMHNSLPLGFPQGGYPVLKGLITVRLEPKTPSVETSLKRTLTFAWMQDFRSQASMRK